MGEPTGLEGSSPKGGDIGMACLRGLRCGLSSGSWLGNGRVMRSLQLATGGKGQGGVR